MQLIGCVAPMCELLSLVSDARIINAALAFVESVLKLGASECDQAGGSDGVNQCALLVQQAAGEEKIRALLERTRPHR
jgi:hypothetical protein